MIFSDILFAPAWWMLVAGIGLAGLLLFLANKRLDKALRNAGLGVLTLVVAWAVVGRLVETPREAAGQGTRAFVAAVVDRDGATIDRLLSAGATCGSFSKADLIEKIGPYSDTWGLRSARISGSDIEDRGSQVACTVRIFSQHEGNNYAGPLTTDWRFIWAKDDATWRILTIEPIRVGNDDSTTVVDKYFSKSR